jgi:hypothetical protein
MNDFAENAGYSAFVSDTSLTRERRERLSCLRFELYARCSRAALDE